MTKSYCSLKLLEVSSVVPSTNKLFKAPHHPSFFQLLVNCLDHDISSFLFQCTPSSLWWGVRLGDEVVCERSMDDCPFVNGDGMEARLGQVGRDNMIHYFDFVELVLDGLVSRRACEVVQKRNVFGESMS
ncbi:hypothetical protein Tco_1338006 [Tanacetum coccineum]